MQTKILSVDDMKIYSKIEPNLSELKESLKKSGMKSRHISLLEKLFHLSWDEYGIKANLLLLSL